jgi:parallel beta-helix repeat protein
MRNTLFRKGLAVGLILLFIGTSVVPTFNAITTKDPKPIPNRGNWLYVGGSGPGNYTTIQSAIDAANPGDTVFVFNGTYYESLHLEKSLYLQGENRTTTIIDSRRSSYSITIYKGTIVTIRGFTIQNSSKHGINSEAIEIVTIDNIIQKHEYVGICLKNSTKAIITDNIISQNKRGLCLCWCCCNSTISYNMLESNTDCAIYIFNSSHNRIVKNKMIHNFYNIFLAYSDYNNISQNSIENCSFCNTYFYHANHCSILKNNFINYQICALFSCCRNTWEGNYWNEPRFLPKPIFGVIGQYGLIPWVNFDWHPAQKQYVIN